MEILLRAKEREFPLYELMNVCSRAVLYKKEFSIVENMFGTGAGFGNMQFSRLYDKLANCYDELERIEEWITFTAARRTCEQNGLASFVTAVFGKEQNKGDWISVFWSTFYSKWLTYVFAGRMDKPFYFVRNLQEAEEIERLDKEKMDLRKLDIEDYIRTVPIWLSRCRKCLIMKENNIETPFYDKVSIDNEL